VLEQNTVISSTWKDEDPADSCSLGSENSSTLSQNVSYQCLYLSYRVSCAYYSLGTGFFYCQRFTPFLKRAFFFCHNSEVTSIGKNDVVSFCVNRKSAGIAFCMSAPVLLCPIHPT
jgi:hypothetical protein